jgi:hypothetical protein
MDLYQEARWTFETFDRVAWYRTVVLNTLVAPRLGRFGELTGTCAPQCANILAYRIGTGNPLGLFADIGNLEYNDPCKICIETSYEQTIQQLHGSVGPAFMGLAAQVTAYNANPDNGTTPEDLEKNAFIAQSLTTLAASVTLNDVRDFHKYYVERGLYAQLGAESYLTSYQSFAPYIELCISLLGNETCPTHPNDMTPALAQRDLLRHADNVFSNVTAAGAPFPFWSEPDGTGNLFQPNAEGTFYPVSGSGIDMSGDIMSLLGYLQGTGGAANPASDAWASQVEINPLYAWFMASVELAEPYTCKCYHDMRAILLHARTARFDNDVGFSHMYTRLSYLPFLNTFF